MKFRSLWAVRTETKPEIAEALADSFGDGVLSLSILAPPRSKQAQIEAIYAEKPDRADLTARLAIAAALHKAKPPKIDIREMPKLDWLKKVAADFLPLPIGRWIIHGAQHREAATTLARSGSRHALQIDATNAFGTGEHPTTRGCLLMLEWILKSGFCAQRMLDMGCGSGILAMGWAKTQPGYAIAVDSDVDSVRIAKNNARANGLSGKIRVAKSFGYRGFVRRNAPYDLIMANIFAKPLAHMAKDLKQVLRPGGVAILSGLLASQANLVLAAHRMQKIYPVRIFRIGEWVVLVLRRKSKPAPPGNRRSSGRLA